MQRLQAIPDNHSSNTDCETDSTETGANILLQYIYPYSAYPINMYYAYDINFTISAYSRRNKYDAYTLPCVAINSGNCIHNAITDNNPLVPVVIAPSNVMLQTTVNNITGGHAPRVVVTYTIIKNDTFTINCTRKTWRAELYRFNAPLQSAKSVACVNRPDNYNNYNVVFQCRQINKTCNNLLEPDAINIWVRITIYIIGIGVINLCDIVLVKSRSTLFNKTDEHITMADALIVGHSL